MLTSSQQLANPPLARIDRSSQVERWIQAARVAETDPPNAVSAAQLITAKENANADAGATGRARKKGRIS
jgi:hypothetical protein